VGSGNEDEGYLGLGFVSSSVISRESLMMVFYFSLSIFSSAWAFYC
jgi:hypothetical protein